MACFIVPASEAVVTTIVTKAVEAKERKSQAAEEGVQTSGQMSTHTGSRFVKKLHWLNSMLWGGSALLAFEHVWHGEVVPYFPFLTAAANPEETAQMLHEMATVGSCMALAVTAAWVALVCGSTLIERRMTSMTDAAEADSVKSAAKAR